MNTTMNIDADLADRRRETREQLAIRWTYIVFGGLFTILGVVGALYYIISRTDD